MTTSADCVRIDVLGPLRACDSTGRDVTPEGLLQRRLLALLVLRRGRAVSVDAAIDALWPARRPRDPAAALHNHLFRLRRGLPDGLIESVGNGYRLDPTAVDLDADRLAAAVAAGAAVDPTASATVDALLERWHGPAYPELDDVDDGRAESTRLEALRIVALEAQAERRLAAGAVDEVVVAMTALAEEQPLRERPRSLLMTALAAAGRNGEALRVYDDFRRRLGDELGIEPSPALGRQHADLLTGTGTGAVAWSPATRLPAPVTSLVGRDALVAELTVAAETERFVTLVGPGGVGKTRLLIELGRRLGDADAGRPVVMCELATASEESALDVVAASLTIDARPGVPPAERLAGVLADAAIVLLLDNCEHVLEPVAGLVERLLAACPRVTVVATSRERLRAPGEHLRVVPPLATDSGQAPAVELFVQRARAVAPGFEPDAGELDALTEVVGRLDGLPLAIELAAARMHTHDLAELAAGLDDRFVLLSFGHRTSSRHESLGAAVEWSFGLLDERLQQFFAELSVFTGSFGAPDAAAVCAVDVGAATVAVHQLAERSLVTRAPDRRFVLLETLRAFGAEQLAAAGRTDEVAERHARHQVAWIERAHERLIEDAPGSATIVEIDAALPELRAALDWLVAHDHVELAGRMIAALHDYGFLRLKPDVLAWADRVTEADPDDRSPWAPIVWGVSAYAAWMAGDVGETGVRSARALRLCELSGREVPPMVAESWASYELFEGRLAAAAGWFRRAVEAAGDDRARRSIAASAEVLALAYAADPLALQRADELLAHVGEACSPYAAYAWFCAGEADLPVDVDRARTRFGRALQLAEATNASFVTGVAGAAKASIEARVGDPLRAADDYRRLITHWRRAGMWSTQWTMLRSIAGLLARLGRPRDAAVLEGAVRATPAGHRIFGADEVALAELGARLRAELGDEAYVEALGAGASLDGDAAIEHALGALAAATAAGG